MKQVRITVMRKVCHKVVKCGPDGRSCWVDIGLNEPAFCINMEDKNRERDVIALASDMAKDDPARPEIHGIIALGLLEISRRRS